MPKQFNAEPVRLTEPAKLQTSHLSDFWTRAPEYCHYCKTHRRQIQEPGPNFYGKYMQRCEACGSMTERNV